MLSKPSTAFIVLDAEKKHKLHIILKIITARHKYLTQKADLCIQMLANEEGPELIYLDLLKEFQ